VSSASDADYYRLRTEWLRFKSQLFDAGTGLPALPAVIDAVRRLAEARGALDVVYLDLGRSAWHEAKLGFAAFDDGVREFARLLGGLRGAELGPEDVVCVYTVRSDRFLVFQPVLREGEGDAGPAASCERLLRAVRRRVHDAPAASVLRAVRVRAGYGRTRETPMVRAERSLQQAVAEAILMVLAQRESADAARLDELHRLIAGRRLKSAFHPVVRLADGQVVGHEALTRPVDVLGFDSVEDLFAFAETTEYLLEFERLCRHTAIGATPAVPALGLLFLNASPRAVQDPDWSNGGMDRLLREHGLSPGDVVVEITERTAVGRLDVFQAALKGFKERGYRVAVDDMGAGYASLQSLAAVEPDFLKFDTSLVRDIDASSIKRGLLESLRALAEKIHAQVIAEGVEREEERRTLIELGIELGQGYLFHPDGALR
jgi:EAL domain-containing protein (putative c-di-GMP-specific phosphodiesterase class I)